ncbi:MAG: cardiolipin synthase [Lentisphaerae bacterium]|jgi:cardiolipin synthase|nr:cardiolipin synthase [Lentisphaerota bacterium]
MSGFAWMEFFRGMPWLSWGALIHALLFVSVVLHVLRHRRRADSTLLWLFVTWSLPVVGAVLYAMFGVDRVPKMRWHRGVERRVRMDGARRAAKDEVLPAAYWQSMGRDSVTPADEWTQFLDRPMAAMLDNFPLLGGNHVEPLLTGDEAFPRMLEAIRNAEHHIHLQSFIIGNDDVGREFMDAVAERAREGVQVRVLYDRFGSSHALWGGLFRRYRRVPNLSMSGWTQSNLFRKQLHFNLRNHRKILVADGRIGFMGGINLNDYSRSRENESSIQDYHFELRGPIVQVLQYSFLRDWHVMTEENPEKLLSVEHFGRQPSAGGALARVINSGPSSDLQVAVDMFFNAVNAAREQVFILTPYFLPSDDLMRALRLAALRGVQVYLVVPEKSNHWYTTWASRAVYEDLLEAGVRIFERPPPFIHAKAMTVDDRMAIVGSANWDYRSLFSNYETSLVVYDAQFVMHLKLLMGEDLSVSRELKLQIFKERPVAHRYLENFCGLFTPLL